MKFRSFSASKTLLGFRVWLLCSEEMAEHQKEESVVESVMDKISEKLHSQDSSSSSSDSDNDEKSKSPSSPSSFKSKVYRIFGREKPVHKVLGGGKRMFPFSTFTNCLFWCFAMHHHFFMLVL